MISPFVAAAMMASATQAAQQPAEAFDVRHAVLDVGIDFGRRRLDGSMTYTLENRTSAPAQRISLLLGRLMDARAVADERGPLKFTQDVVRFTDDPMRQVTQVIATMRSPVPPGGRVQLRVEYGGALVGYTEIGWLYVRDRIDTTFTILREEAMAFPVVAGLSNAANRSVARGPFTYVARVRVPRGFGVAVGGQPQRTDNADGTVTWQYTSMGVSPFLNVAIARYDTIAAPGLRLSYFPADSAGARRLAAGARSALDSMTAWFGPLRTQTTLSVAEIPDGWGSQSHLVGGIIQTAAAFREASEARQLYHELSHLWNVVDADVPSPRWNEGLATFLEALLLEKVDGWSGRATYEARIVERLRASLATDSTLRQVPLIQFGQRSMTGRSYTLGALMFAVLYQAVGAESFNRIVRDFYQAHPAGATTREFTASAQRSAQRNLSGFFDDWLFTTRWTSLIQSAPSVEALALEYSR